MYYKLVRKLFQRAARKMCQDCKDFIKEGSEILDLGCGSGVVGQEFAKFFKAKITGIDIKDYRVEKIPFQIFDGLNIPFPEKSFDVVLVNFVLHHARDPIYLLREAKRVSRDKIIIFEDLPEGFISKFFCWFHGTSFDTFFKNPNRTFFKTEKEWLKVFEELNIKTVFNKITHNFPRKKELFILGT